MTQWSKKGCIRLMRSPLVGRQVKKNNKIKQKQQTLITSQIDVFFFKEKYAFFKNKLINKVKIASDKNENKQTCTSSEKNMGALHKKGFVTNRQKQTKKKKN